MRRVLSRSKINATSFGVSIRPEGFATSVENSWFECVYHVFNVYKVSHVLKYEVWCAVDLVDLADIVGPCRRLSRMRGVPVVKEGDTAPDFTLPDEQGTLVRLADFRGTRVVLWFYVRDFTAG